MSWSLVELPKIAFFQEGPGVRNWQFRESGIKLINVKNIVKGILKTENSNKYLDPQEVKEKYTHFLTEVDDLVMAASGATWGKLAWVESKHLPLCMNTSMIRFQSLNEEELNIRYLYYYLKTNEFRKKMERLITGSAQPNFGSSHLKQIKIPLPPLPEQQKIAAILDAADTLRQKDQQLIEHYNALSQSLFLEMFGDPVSNPMGWDESSMANACTKVTDGTHDTPKRLNKGVKFITGKHIKPYAIDYINSDYVTQEVHDEIYRRCNPNLGDVLYTNIGVNLGTAAYNSVEYEFSMKNVALLKPKSEFLNGRFLEYFLNNEIIKKKIIWMTSIGGAQKFLSLSQLRKLDVLLPPITLQNQFAERIQAIESQKQQAQASLQKSEDLFNSLLQRAFKGELTA